MSVSRRELFGMFRRSPAPEPETVTDSETETVTDSETETVTDSETETVTDSVTDSDPASFSLDDFYRDRAPARTLPLFRVRASETHATTRVGAGPGVASPPPSRDHMRAGGAPAFAVAADQVPRVLESACLATRSFCSVCVERCPRPGAIVVERGRPRVVAAACDGCGQCIAVCPAPVLAFELVARATPFQETPGV